MLQLGVVLKIGKFQNCPFYYAYHSNYYQYWRDGLKRILHCGKLLISITKRYTPHDFDSFFMWSNIFLIVPRSRHFSFDPLIYNQVANIAWQNRTINTKTTTLFKN